METTEQGLSLSDVLTALKRRRFTGIAVALPIVTIAVVLATALPDVYRSSAKFRVMTNRVEELASRPLDYADQYILNLRDKVLSRTTLLPIIEEVDPYPELKDDPPEAMSRLSEDVDVRMQTQTFLDSTLGRERLVTTGFLVSYDHDNPEKARAVAAVLADAFIEASRSVSAGTASGKVSFYAGEADRLNGQIMEFEKRLAEFKEKNFERLPETAQANIGIRARYEQELEGVQRELAVLRQNRVFLSHQLTQARTVPATENLHELEQEYARKAAIYSETHPDLVALRRQIDRLRTSGATASGSSAEAQLEAQRAQLAEVRQRYSEDHPDVRRLTRSIEGLEAQIAAGGGGYMPSGGQTVLTAQLQTQLSATDTQIASLEGRRLELQRRLDQFEARLGSTPEVEREYQSLTRGLDTARIQYNEMVAKRLNAEADVAAITSGAADRFQMVEAPRAPLKPAAPPRVPILIIGAVAALLLSLSAMVGAEVVDPRVRGARDLRGVLGMTPLAVIPEIHNSVFLRQRRQRLMAIAASMLAGTPVLYALVHFVSR